MATGNVRDENKKFESDRTSSISEKIKTKQSLLSAKVSRSHQIPSYQTNTTSKFYEYINKYINKFTTPYFNSFWQLFHIPFFHNIFGRRLFCCYEKLFQQVHKKVIKVEK